MSELANPAPAASLPAPLRSEFLRLAAWGVAALLGLALLLASLWSWPAALQWLTQALLIWAFVCQQTRRRLPLNRADADAPLYPQLGLANRLTLLRSWLIASVGGFLLQPWPEGAWLAWLPGMLYFAAALLDRVDGFVARRSGQFSLLGSELDTVSDALGLAVASVLAVGYGQTHWSFLLMGFAYYAFQGGLWWRQQRGLAVHPLPPQRHRRVWAGFQMGYLVVALWPLIYPPLTHVGGFAFMLPALLGFGIDWLVVSGRLDRKSASVDGLFRRLTWFSLAVLQPGLRVFVVGALTLLLWRHGFPPDMGSGLAWVDGLMAVAFVVTALMILLGIAGRYFSLLMIGLLASWQISNPLEPLAIVLFCAVVWLLMLGTGRFSLWLKDDDWLNGYDGA